MRRIIAVPLMLLLLILEAGAQQAAIGFCAPGSRGRFLGAFTLAGS